jgi:hypothetical protein
MPGRLVFSVTQDGSASPSEALRITNDRNIQITQSAGKYALDVTPSSVSIANNGTVDFAGASGLFIVTNWSNGNGAVMFCAAGGVITIANQGTAYGSMAYNAGVGAYRFTNNVGSTQTFAFMFFRTRNSP